VRCVRVSATCLFRSRHCLRAHQYALHNPPCSDDDDASLPAQFSAPQSQKRAAASEPATSKLSKQSSSVVQSKPIPSPATSAVPVAKAAQPPQLSGSAKQAKHQQVQQHQLQTHKTAAAPAVKQSHVSAAGLSGTKPASLQQKPQQSAVAPKASASAATMSDDEDEDDEPLPFNKEGGNEFKKTIAASAAASAPAKVPPQPQLKQTGSTPGGAKLPGGVGTSSTPGRPPATMSGHLGSSSGTAPASAGAPNTAGTGVSMSGKKRRRKMRQRGSSPGGPSSVQA
jgi:hypothetical protein